jgi:hypothetical protein
MNATDGAATNGMLTTLTAVLAGMGTTATVLVKGPIRQGFFEFRA